MAFLVPENWNDANRPSYVDVALKYPELRVSTIIDEHGNVILDFRTANREGVLAVCLLKEFGITIEQPADRQLPAIPLRLRYINFLEEIVGKKENVWGVDVGTGASCIFPLLAATRNGWKFLALESNMENTVFARKNVAANGREDLIHVRAVSAETILLGPLQFFQANTHFDFCMCNPPFFADILEPTCLTATRHRDMHQARQLAVTNPHDMAAKRNEIEFICRMIKESAVLKNKIRVYSSMVGKKSSLAILTKELGRQKVANFTTTHFWQERTIRWAIAWTYDSTVKLPLPRKSNPQQCLLSVWAGSLDQQVHQMAAFLRQQLESIKVHCSPRDTTTSSVSFTLTAVKNTWIRNSIAFKQQVCVQQGETSHKTKTAELEDCPERKGDSEALEELSGKLQVTVSLDHKGSNNCSSNLKRPAEESVEKAKRFRETTDGCRFEAATPDNAFDKAWKTFCQSSASGASVIGESKEAEASNNNSQCSLPGHSVTKLCDSPAAVENLLTKDCHQTKVDAVEELSDKVQLNISLDHTGSNSCSSECINLKKPAKESVGESATHIPETNEDSVLEKAIPDNEGFDCAWKIFCQSLISSASVLQDHVSKETDVSVNNSQSSLPGPSAIKFGDKNAAVEDLPPKDCHQTDLINLKRQADESVRESAKRHQETNEGCMSEVTIPDNKGFDNACNTFCQSSASDASVIRDLESQDADVSLSAIKLGDNAEVTKDMPPKDCHLTKGGADSQVQLEKLTDKVQLNTLLDHTGSNSCGSDCINLKRPAEKSFGENAKRLRETNEGCVPEDALPDNKGFTKAWNTFCQSSASDASVIRDLESRGAVVTDNNSQSSLPGPAAKLNDKTAAVNNLPPKTYILKCVMKIQRVDNKVKLELDWIDGQARYLMNQIMVFLKNKLAQPHRCV